ncbi:CDK-activating kinase assembly factor MAT1 [Acrasis kona]|uniref:CDK-activating kinase assembly factor MAT1 n=1 Tax=Acrasis kona TaxID=1008807 RepID=A0AAW2Z729_9EUKA
MSKRAAPMSEAEQIMDKENRIRKAILKDYNKTQQDFENLKEYNDFLEEVEDIIFNIVNDIDVEETQEKIREYRNKNKMQIARNRARKDEEVRRKKQLAEEEVRKQQEAEAEALNPTAAAQKQNVNTAFIPNNAPLVFAPQPVPKNQDAINAFMEFHNIKYQETQEQMQQRAKAGGYKMDYPLKRAEEEAFSTVILLQAN